MKKIFLFLSISIMISCSETKKKYDTGHFSEKLMNFEDVNTIYDDYNSTAPFIYHLHLFHFSSNRNSYGNDYDIVGENMYINWSKVNGTLEIRKDLVDERFDYLMPMFDSINTDCNELGPYSLGFMQDISYSEVLWTDLLMYASDCGGDYDIKFVYSELYNTTDTVTTQIEKSRDISFLNSKADDLYPTFYGNDFYYHDEWGIDPAKIEKILYCSNREGDFNLYEVSLPSGSNLIDKLKTNTQFESFKMDINSDSEDKCPYVNGKLLVFASEREGGYGGFDLYYSEFKDGKWSQPENFGEKINSEYDEYRPITLFHRDFENNLMIFSSNRPGGKGGFDLYHVGIRQKIK